MFQESKVYWFAGGVFLFIVLVVLIAQIYTRRRRKSDFLPLEAVDDENLNEDN